MPRKKTTEELPPEQEAMLQAEDSTQQEGTVVEETTAETAPEVTAAPGEAEFMTPEEVDAAISPSEETVHDVSQEPETLAVMPEIVEVEQEEEGEPEPDAATLPSEGSDWEPPEADDLLPVEDTPTEEVPIEESPAEDPTEKKPAKVRAVRRSGRGKTAKPTVPESSESEQGGAAKEESAKEQASGDERKAFYGLDFNELDRDLTPEQRQEWNSIYASYRGHSVMTGTVVGIDRHRFRMRDRKTGELTWHRMYCAIVIPFRVRILIPETEMWLNGEERPGFVMRGIPGATIDFVIIHVDRQAGFAVASRRLALPSRRYYFSTQPDLHKPGSRVECQVLVVGPRRCLVSCYGYDLSVTQRELSYTAVPDLRDVYHTGQTLGCIVKSYDPRGGGLTISVKECVPNPYDGVEFRHPVQSHRQAVIAGKYGGGVFCNLPDGVTVMCSYSFHYDDSAFQAGDRVMLIIQRYDDSKKQIYGKIVAKC